MIQLTVFLLAGTEIETLSKKRNAVTLENGVRNRLIPKIEAKWSRRHTSFEILVMNTCNLKIRLFSWKMTALTK